MTAFAQFDAALNAKNGAAGMHSTAETRTRVGVDAL